MRRFLLWGLCVAALASGCVSRSTDETEVGVLVCKVSLGCPTLGIQAQVYPPGSTTFFAPWIRDWFVFDTKIQNLEMVLATEKGDREDRDDVLFKTTDGADVSMDVTVVWGIQAAQAPFVLENVAHDTDGVKEKLVRPMARTLIRDVLNSLDSESIYNADRRFAASDEAQKKLAAALSPYGVMVSQVILHEHRFTPEYEKIIHDRKLAEQRAEQLKSEAEAATQEALRDLEAARGKVASDMAGAQGQLDKSKLEADAFHYEQSKNAEAIVAESEAEAQAIAKRNEALRGAGGRAMVKLKIADALVGKPIVLVPGGGSGGVQRLDVNKLIERMLMETGATADAPAP
jgi:regulator of protease activity HflC (stomatin/prohibitin superfamily)